MRPSWWLALVATLAAAVATVSSFGTDRHVGAADRLAQAEQGVVLSEEQAPAPPLGTARGSGSADNGDDGDSNAGAEAGGGGGGRDATEGAELTARVGSRTASLPRSTSTRSALVCNAIFMPSYTRR
jgi:hypothetical protein